MPRFLTYTIGADRDWRECKDRQLWLEIVNEREIGRQCSHSRAFMAMPVSYYWAQYNHWTVYTFLIGQIVLLSIRQSVNSIWNPNNDFNKIHATCKSTSPVTTTQVRNKTNHWHHLWDDLCMGIFWVFSSLISMFYCCKIWTSNNFCKWNFSGGHFGCSGFTTVVICNWNTQLFSSYMNINNKDI